VGRQSVRKEVAKRWTATFDKIPEEKRRRVLDSAKKAFAHYGYAGTNVNLVAREAGISVGSLYQYFRTKEDIFLALIEYSHGLLAGIIDGIFASDPGFFPRVQRLLDAAVEESLSDPELLNLYIACTTEELAPLAGKLSGSLESITASRYRQMVGEAKVRGEIRADADEAATAFCLDNLFMAVQFSFGSAYYKERLALYVGKAALARPAIVKEGVLSFIRRSLAPAPPARPSRSAP
jgi:TetR/AcrR family transcriptional regulator